MKEVTAAVIFKNGKVLITRRSPSEKMVGYWEFPGGKVEKGETPQECLVRELREELNLITKADDIVYKSEYVYDHGSFRILAISTEILSGDIQLSVHDEYAWVLLNELVDYQLLPADRPIAEYLKNTYVAK